MTLIGLVATAPRHLVTSEGLPITSFRLASNQRRFDNPTGKWMDAGTNWYTVSTFRDLALNVAGSIHKGDRIVVTGRLRISDWSVGERKGTSIELDATAIGHDLSWGKSSFTRSIRSIELEAVASAPGPEEADEDADGEAEEEFGGLPAAQEELPVPF